MAFLTIDDAPSARFEVKLDYLIDHRIPAFFFCQGSEILGREDSLSRALSFGYRLGNHSYSHPHFSELSLEECRREIEAADTLINSLYERASESWTRKYFRFPFFDRGGDARKAGEIQGILKDLGYSRPETQSGDTVDVGCTFDQMEYYLGNPDAPNGLDRAEAILARIDASHPGQGDVILIHDHEKSHELFFECLDRYLKNGICFEPFR
jgi:peptidoglycan/xylan/chitin deacetylase (PgdA/CDA1 family)